MNQEPRTPFPVERAFCVPELKSLDRDARSIRHTITTNSIDRAGDIVEPKGADLRSFKRNPVVMVDHSHSVRDIIGRAVDVEKTDDGIEATTVFGTAGLGPEAFSLVESGMARAWSIGFRSTDHHSVRHGAKNKCATCKARWDDALAEAEKNGDDTDGEFLHVRGLHFLGWELLEYSLVAIPMNQDVVSNAIREGIVTEKNVASFFRFMPGHDLDTVERIIGGQRTNVSKSSDTGKRPDSEETNRTSDRTDTRLYEAILDWGAKLKRQNDAADIADAVRRLRS